VISLVFPGLLIPENENAARRRRFRDCTGAIALYLMLSPGTV
jgi:hypothetical protein